MILAKLSVGMLQTNCYIAGCDRTGNGVVIDPGAEGARIVSEVRRLRIHVQYVLITHAHFDHTGGAKEFVAATGASLAVHSKEKALLEMDGGAARLGFRAEPSPPPDLILEAGDEIPVGDLCFRVLSVPGHSPGGVAYYEPTEGVVFVGDALFREGVGRTDLPGGDSRTLLASVSQVLFSLPEETTVYPGHGPPTTIRHEKACNPFV